MSRFYPQNLMGCRHRSCKFYLVVWWLTGIAGGLFLAADAGVYFSLMRACCDCRVSIVNLLLIPCFPFLISAIAVYFLLPMILYLCAAFKMFCFTYCICSLFATFAHAGLLVCVLLMFTNLLTVPALCRFQWLCASNGRKYLFRNAAVCLLWFAVVCTVDYLWIAPLLRDIF